MTTDDTPKEESGPTVRLRPPSEAGHAPTSPEPTSPEPPGSAVDTGIEDDDSFAGTYEEWLTEMGLVEGDEYEGEEE